MDALRSEVRRLRLMVYGLSAVCALALLGAASSFTRDGSFDVLNVHRINVLDDNGTLRLVIANKDHFPPPMMHGKPFAVGYRSISTMPAFIFYNAQGDEQGGLVWSGGRHGSHYSQSAFFDWDQYEQNDAMGVSYSDVDGRRSAGIEGTEHETTPIDVVFREMLAAERGKSAQERAAIEARFHREHFGGATRFFVGFAPEGGSATSTSQVMLADAAGRPRIKMFVTADGRAHLQFLDARGRVTAQYPDF